MDEGRKGREGREGNLFDEMYKNLRRPADRPVSPVIPRTKKQEERLRKYRKKKEEEGMIPDYADEIGTQDIDPGAFATDLEASDEETEEEKIRRIARELRNTKKLIATSIGYTLSS